MYSDIVKSITDKITSSIKVALPGVIEKYDFKTQKANIRIDIKELLNDETEIEYPILASVPIFFFRSGNAGITFPVSAGDTCLVIFCDRDITNWMSGNSKQKTNTRRMHHLSDAVAFVGLMPFSKQSLALNNDDLLIKYQDCSVALTKNGSINIKAGKEINVECQDIIINCKNANVNSEQINVSSKNVTFNVTENATVNCDTATIKANSNIGVECKEANFQCDLVVSGKVEVGQKLTTKSGIENSGGNLVSNNKTFETHVHTYTEVTQVIAPSGGGVCQITKVQSNTSATQ